MNLLADENVNAQVVARLRDEGHSVEWVAELSPSVSDEAVLQLADDRTAVLLTEDKDFGELVYRRGLAHSGILLIRLDGLDNSKKAEIVCQVVRDNEADLPGAFAVVSRDSLRLRRLGGE